MSAPNYTKIAQIVDTLKLHFYHGNHTTQSDFNRYVAFVNELKELKKQAMEIHHSNNEMRFIKTQIGMDSFRVMAATIRSFQVTIQNHDLSISFKTHNHKPQTQQQTQSTEFLSLTPNPVIKVEFRASFLARMGLTLAKEYLLHLIQKFVLPDYTIKVSEIHLATDIQGYPFNSVDFCRFSTPKRTIAAHDQENEVGTTYYYQGRRFTGFSLGGGDEMLRIYNKSIEIKKKKDKAFIESLVWERNAAYDPTQEVWRIEVQYRREKLKTLSDSKSGLLDGFEVVLDSIPTLWQRALEQFNFKDLSDQHALEAMLGYQEVDGVHRPIPAKTIAMRKLRSKTHPLWTALEGWNGFEPNVITPYVAPKTGSFEYVSNAIKSLLSTTLKHVGYLDAEVMAEMFERANLETMEKKGLSLVENAVANTLDYLAEVERQTLEHGICISGQHKLEIGLQKHIQEIMDHLMDAGASDEARQKRLEIFGKRVKRPV